MRKRSISINGHPTSVSLEDAFWAELTAIAADRHLSLNALVTEVDGRRSEATHANGNLSSALRVYVLEEAKRKISRA